MVGGCEDPEFSTASRALWDRFAQGTDTLVLSTHTLREIQGAPEIVRARIVQVPPEYQVLLLDSAESAELAESYLQRGIVGPGSHADALHVALATVGRVDVLASWNFKYIVNLGRIRLFNSVNISMGYGALVIRTPKEVIAGG